MADEEQPEAASPPETLLSWLKGDGKVGPFVAALKKRGEGIDSADLEAAVTFLQEEPGRLGRGAEFVRTAAAAAGPLRMSALNFGQRVITSQHAVLGTWLRDEAAHAEEELRLLTAASDPLLRSKDPKSKRQGELLMAIGLAVFSGKRRAQPEMVLEAVADAYGLAKPEAPGDTRPARVLVSLIGKRKPRQLLEYAAVARLFEQKVARAEADEQRALSRAARAERAAASLEEQLRKVTEANTRLEEQARQLEKELLAAKSQIASVRTVGAHDVAGLRARSRRVLGEEIKTLAVDAKDALEIDPPRPDFARVYLGELVEKIEGEVRWLSERSG